MACVRAGCHSHTGNVCEACITRSTHAPDPEDPDVLYPLLWAYLMDREEVGVFTQVYTAWGSRRICWLCLLETLLFNRGAENTPELMQQLTRTRQAMYEIMRDHPDQCVEHSIHPIPPLAMDLCHVVPVDYSWVLADRFHHITVVMWRVKTYTEKLLKKLKNLTLLDKRFQETPRHTEVKPWPRGIIKVDKVLPGGVMTEWQGYCAVAGNWTSKQAQGEELIELFRGFLVILHGILDFADWIALLSYSVWLDFLFRHQYTEEDLAKLERLRRNMKEAMRKSQLFTKSPYVMVW